MVRIEKSFKTGFAFSLISFVALNALFSLIVAGLNEDLLIDSIPEYLFGAIIQSPSNSVEQIFFFFFNLNAISVLEYVGYIVPPLVASIIAGWFNGGGKKTAFLSWYLVAVIGSITIYVFKIVLFASGVEAVLSYVFFILVKGLIIGLLYGAITMLVNPEYY